MIKGLVLALFLGITSSGAAQPQKLTSPTWSPATYRDLTVGISTKEDVLRLLGKPSVIGREQDTGLPTMTYEVRDPVPGTLTIYIQKGVLNGMTLLPKKHLMKDEVLRLFGPNYMIARYDTDDCLTEGGSAPLYESPVGSIKHMEYRNKGVAVVLHDDEGVAIVFVSRPFGPTRSQCAGHHKK